MTVTGELIVVVSAGTGVFEVDSQLARDTKEKMIEVGIGKVSLPFTVPSPLFLPRLLVTCYRELPLPFSQYSLIYHYRISIYMLLFLLFFIFTIFLMFFHLIYFNLF